MWPSILDVSGHGNGSLLHQFGGGNVDIILCQIGTQACVKGDLGGLSAATPAERLPRAKSGASPECEVRLFFTFLILVCEFTDYPSQSSLTR